MTRVPRCGGGVLDRCGGVGLETQMAGTLELYEEEARLLRNAEEMIRRAGKVRTKADAIGERVPVDCGVKKISTAGDGWQREAWGSSRGGTTWARREKYLLPGGY